MSPLVRRVSLSIAGIILGFFIAGLQIREPVGDLGLVLLMLGFMYSIGLVILLNSVAELIFGTARSKKIAVLFLVGLVLIAVFSMYSQYKSDQRRYCNGVPVSEYQGSLPAMCQP